MRAAQEATGREGNGGQPWKEESPLAVLQSPQTAMDLTARKLVLGAPRSHRPVLRPPDPALLSPKVIDLERDGSTNLAHTENTRSVGTKGLEGITSTSQSLGQNTNP